MSVTAAVELENDMVGAEPEDGLGVDDEAGAETVDEAEAVANDKAGGEDNAGAASETGAGDECRAGNKAVTNDKAEGDGNAGAGSETGAWDECKAGDGAVVGGESGAGDEAVTGGESGTGDEAVTGDEDRASSGITVVTGVGARIGDNDPGENDTAEETEDVGETTEPRARARTREWPRETGEFGRPEVTGDFEGPGDLGDLRTRVGVRGVCVTRCLEDAVAAAYRGAWRPIISGADDIVCVYLCAVV